jgi:tetratricopeptide (TPR) repeat protein
MRQLLLPCRIRLRLRGICSSLLNRLDIALESYEGALDANPSNALAWLLKGTLHAFRSEGQLAVEHTGRARMLTPLDPFHYFYDSLSATACAAAGKYEKAVKFAERSLRANRKHTSTWRALTVAQWRLDRHEDARQSVCELLKLQPSLTVSGWLRSSPAAPYPIGRETAEVMRLAGVPE